MNKRSFLKFSLAAGAAHLLPAAKAAITEFPARPVRLIVPFTAGNVLDNAMRDVAAKFHENTGQTLVIENRPGGAGIIAAQSVKNAAPDGHTLLLATNSLFALNPHTFKDLPYKPEENFTLVTNVIGMTMVLAIRSDIPAANLAEFVSWVKKHPNGTSFGSFTIGNSSHFMGAMLNQLAGLDLLHVPFNGTPAVVQNLIGGRIDAAFLPLNAVKSMVDSGRIKVVGVSSPARSSLLPQVETFREAGYPTLELYIWAGLAAPAQTPAQVVDRLNTEFVKILQLPEIHKKWAGLDMAPLPSSPGEFKKFLREDSERWGQAVRVSGFKAKES